MPDRRKRCYVFDLDGTLADVSHRLHHIQKEPKDWRTFFAACRGDTPILHMIELLKRLWATAPVIIVSGRSDECAAATAEWLEEQGLPTNAIHLYMRRDGDHRPDHIVKSELADEIANDGFEIIMAFDDRNQVVEMWRKRGIPCAQVAEGDF